MNNINKISKLFSILITPILLSAYFSNIYFSPLAVDAFENNREQMLIKPLTNFTNSPNAATSITVDHNSIDSSDNIIPQSYLDQARNLDILFGHASVGGNILAGIDDLESLNPTRYSINRYSSDTPASLLSWFDSSSGIGDFGAGTNGDPSSKISELQEKVITYGLGSHIDVAFVKFCYVDNVGDVDAVWTEYRDKMLAMETAYPDVTFVWWTMTLKIDGNEWRDNYNTLVRNYTSANKKVLFDIADIETHTPEGNLDTNMGFQHLYPSYAADSGHLNEIGRQRVARAFWWLFAKIAGWGSIESDCTSLGGTWIESLQECRYIDEEDCSVLGGTFNGCASACIDLPENAGCTQNCISACGLGSILKTDNQKNIEENIQIDNQLKLDESKTSNDKKNMASNEKQFTANVSKFCLSDTFFSNNSWLKSSMLICICGL